MVPWILACLGFVSRVLYPTTPTVFGPELARAIDEAAHAHPLPGRDGVEEMAAELAVLAGTEGHFRADAVGPDAFGVAIGVWQIHETTLPWLGATPDDARDVRRGAELAARLVAKSHAVCSRRPATDALAWYASGGPSCDVEEGLIASRRRMALAARVRRAVPCRFVDATPR